MSWDELGDTLEEIGGVPDRAYRIGEYRRLLDGLAPGTEGHAEVLTCLADDLYNDGQLEAARTTYQAAVDDGGRTVLEPHTGLLEVELAAGDDARADELTVTDYEWIAEILEEAGRLRAALRWFTIPLRDIQPGHVEQMPVVCLNGRFRVRRALGLPVDAYDDAHDVWHELDDARRDAQAG